MECHWGLPVRSTATNAAYFPDALKKSARGEGIKLFVLPSSFTAHKAILLVATVTVVLWVVAQGQVS